MSDHLAAIRRRWWLVAIVLLGTVAAAVAVNARATPIYASSVTFYVSASTNTGTALQADEFAQRRINSYVGLMTSDLLLDRVIAVSDLDLTTGQLRSRVSASLSTDTVIFTTTVNDTDRARALAITSAIAEVFGPMVSELDGTSSGPGTDVTLTVISGPTSSSRPVSPRTTLNLALGVLAGLALGIALAIGREMADRTIRTATDLEEVAGVAQLAAIPRASGRQPHAPDADPGALHDEAYRQLRTNLTFSGIGSELRVVALTSALGGEGKSTTSINLARAMAEMGGTVLLIDADLRRPSVAEYLGLEGGSGLTNVLVGQVEIDDVIQQYGHSTLQILPTGTLPPNPASLLGSSEMENLLITLRDRFDFIVIDTPPLLPVTDAAVIATQVDGVILVARFAKTHRREFVAATSALSAVQARLIGVVLNMVPRREPEMAYTAYTPAPRARQGLRARTRARLSRKPARSRKGSRIEPTADADLGELANLTWLPIESRSARRSDRPQDGAQQSHSSS